MKNIDLPFRIRLMRQKLLALFAANQISAEEEQRGQQQLDDTIARYRQMAEDSKNRS